MARLLFLTNLYPPHFLGGYELMCQEVAVGLSARGHDVAVLCGTPRFKDVPDDAEAGPFSVQRDLELYISTSDLGSSALLRRSPAPPFRRWLEIERHNQAALASALERFQPDAVSVWHMAMVSLGLLTMLTERQVPLVYMVEDNWLAYEERQQSWTRLFTRWPALGRMVRSRVDVPTTLTDVGASGTFLFVSDFERQRSLGASRWEFPHTAVVANGVNRELFARRSDERAWNWDLLYAGRIDHRKGIVTAIFSLLAMPPEATLLIAGRGGTQEREFLIQLVEAMGLGDRVSFTETDRAGVAELYGRADAVIFPSEWAEPFGMVPLEAMSVGVPVVATGTGGSAEFLQHESNCLLFRLGDASALAAQVRRLAEDQGLRDHLVANGAKTAESMSMDVMLDAMEHWHDSSLPVHPRSLTRRPLP